MSDMYDYNYNSPEENGYYFTEEPMNNPIPEAPKKPKKTHKNFNKKMVTRIGALVLSGVLFGGAAAGTFQAVNYLSGGTTQTATTSKTASDTSSSSSLLKTTTVSGTSNTGSLDVSSIAEAAMPSIVSISNKSVQEVQNYFSMFGYGGQTQEQEVESCGSGIIIGKNDTELLIVTNYHVIENADTLSISCIDNSTYEANIKGTDPDNDLAVIAVNLADISEDTMSQIAVATIGDSDSLKVGEQVVAIGNALGYGQSVTTGIVSATNRSLTTSTEENPTTSDSTAEASDTTTDSSEDTATYIQTDAAINPGNSGGALLNMDGEVIGINSAKLASTEIEGMGYAIPTSRISDILEGLMNETTRAKVSTDQQGTLGIKGTSVSSDTSEAYGIPVGVYVSEVTSGGAAEQAGITAQSVITKFDGKSVSDISSLKDMLTYYSAGESIEVTYEIPDANGYVEKTATVTLGQSTSTESTDTPSDDTNGNSNDTQQNFFSNGNSFGAKTSYIQ